MEYPRFLISLTKPDKMKIHSRNGIIKYENQFSSHDVNLKKLSPNGTQKWLSNNQ